MTLEEYERRQAAAAARGEFGLICTVIEDLPSGPRAWLAGLFAGARPEPERELEAGL